MLIQRLRFRIDQLKSGLTLFQKSWREISYVQGQSPQPNTREYFYFIDHQGMLFLDDAKMKNFTSCFKEKNFLRFFFSRLKFNTTENYANEFPYLSLCGNEKNYVRCDDLPIVFTHIIEEEDEYFLSYAHGGDKLKVPFEPEKLYMCSNSGRLYHPSFPKLGNVGLVKSSLAIELSKNFTFSKKTENELQPEYFTWNNKKYKLTLEISDNVKKYSKAYL